MLGSAADAEDVVQETWLRWVGVDLARCAIQRAYLVRITTRQALTRLRTLRRRKESYVGPWLPEPLLTAPDVAEDVELADTVSMAMLLVLETLTPTERAVFVLREVFDAGLRRDRGGRRQDAGRGPPDRAPGPGPRRRPPSAGRRLRGRDPRGARRVPAGGRDRRPAGPARHPRPGRRPARPTAAASSRPRGVPVVGADRVAGFLAQGSPARRCVAASRRRSTATRP